MIELLWDYICKNDHDTMIMVSTLLSWITNQIKNFDKEDVLKLRGFIVIQQIDKRCSILLICDDSDKQKEFLSILQQPPGEFSGKYVARILNNEEPQDEEEKIPKDKDQPNIPIDIG